jgi:hypothetical protein
MARFMSPSPLEEEHKLVATTFRSHGREGAATDQPPRALRFTVVDGDVALLHLPVGSAVEAVAK